VGTLGVGIMNSMVFSLLANSSAGIDESQEMELTIGSLSILIGPSGSTRLSDSTKPDPSASEPEIVAMMESSEGSSSEVNSPVSLGEGQIAKGDEIQEKLDIEVKALKRTIVQGTLPLEIVASPKKYTSYASLSLKQKKITVTRETKGSTGKSTR
jgi:hypothetical protein